MAILAVTSVYTQWRNQGSNWAIMMKRWKSQFQTSCSLMDTGLITQHHYFIHFYQQESPDKTSRGLGHKKKIEHFPSTIRHKRNYNVKNILKSACGPGEIGQWIGNLLCMPWTQIQFPAPHIFHQHHQEWFLRVESEVSPEYSMMWPQTKSNKKPACILIFK